MKRLLPFILSFFFFSSLFAQTLGNPVGDTNTTTSLQENTSFITTGDNLKKLEAKRIELLSTLKLEKERVLEEVKRRDEIQSLLTGIDVLLREISKLTIQKNNLIYSGKDTDLIPDIEEQIQEKQELASEKILTLATRLDFGSYTTDTPFSELQKDFSSLRRLTQNILRSQEKVISDAEKKRSDFIIQKSKELDDVNLEITRLEQIRADQMSQTLSQIGLYIMVFVVLYVIRLISRRLLIRFGRDFSKPHQEALHLAHRWVFNVLFVGAFLVIFSAEFISFLPFIAIVGTAVGLALRDAIYSFIGWFVVGSSSGYQENDFIEFDSTIGRVFRITPLLTTIEEYGPQGFTGKIVSFPNKTIFEKNIKNWSRGSDFSLMSIDFLLTHESDIHRAKDILMSVVGSEELALYYSSRRELRLLKNTYGYTDDDLKPQIHVVTEPRGIILRVRILVHVRDRLSEQSRIMEAFSTLVQKEKNVEMRQV